MWQLDGIGNIDDLTGRQVGGLFEKSSTVAFIMVPLRAWYANGPVWMATQYCCSFCNNRAAAVFLPLFFRQLGEFPLAGSGLLPGFCPRYLAFRFGAAGS